jgi:hypothetical protein
MAWLRFNGASSLALFELNLYYLYFLSIVHDLTTEDYEQYLKNKDNKDSIQKAKRRDSKIRWTYRQERLKNRFIQLLAKFGIKINTVNKNDEGDDLYEEFKKFSKK